jgi:methylated-DNA-[protein]-cysteine S-methyltransferase
MKFSASIVQSSIDSPLGRIILAANGERLAGLWFVDQRHLPDLPRWPEQADQPVLQRAGDQLGEYFAGRRKEFALPLDLSCGSAFQQSVWRALLAIPFGATTSYGTISVTIGKPSAVRAVGGAIGRNPLGIIVPCHRVIGANGALTGYAGGLERKTALLKIESVL